MSNEENLPLFHSFEFGRAGKSPGGNKGTAAANFLLTIHDIISLIITRDLKFSLKMQISLSLCSNENVNYLLVTLSSHDKLPEPSNIPSLPLRFASCRPRWEEIDVR